MPKSRNVRPEEKNAIRILYCRGASVGEIAEEIKCGRDVVTKCLRELGFSVRDTYIPFRDTPERIQDCLHCTASQYYCDHHCSWKKEGEREKE